MIGFRMIACASALALIACDNTVQTSTQALSDDVMTATDSSRTLGNYTVHVNAILTDELTAEIASLYGIARSQNRAMLTVSVIRRGTDGGSTPVTSAVTASATNLSGQLRNLTMREITEGDGIYYIGETVITNAETLVFTIQVRPEDTGQSHTLRYMRQFFVD